MVAPISPRSFFQGHQPQSSSLVRHARGFRTIAPRLTIASFAGDRIPSRSAVDRVLRATKQPNEQGFFFQVETLPLLEKGAAMI